MTARTAPAPGNGAGRLGLSDLGMLLTSTIWAINLSVIKIGLNDVPAHAFNGARLVLASVVFLAVLLVIDRGRPSIAAGDSWKVAALGLAGITGYQFFFIRGILDTPASSASLVGALSPVFIAVLSTIIGQERLSWPAWLGIAVSFAGFYGLIVHLNGAAGLSGAGARGALMILIANVFWAVYTVYSKPVLERIPPFRLCAYATIIGTALYLPFAASEMRRVGWTALPLRAWGTIAYAGILAVVLGFTMWYVSIRRVGSARTGTYSYLNPVIAIAFAVLVMGEHFGPEMVVAALVILAGVALTRSGDRLLRLGRRRAPANGPAAPEQSASAPRVP